MTAPWTQQQKLSALMRLPWSIQFDTDLTDGSFVAQVTEIPDAIGEGTDMKELARDLWESLWASLEIRLEHDDPIPLPKDCALPWEVEDRSRMIPREIRVTQRAGVTVRPVAA